MDTRASELVDILDGMIRLQEELLAVEKRKERAVIGQAWKELEGLVSHSGKVLKSIEEAERKRLSHIVRLGFRREATLTEVAGLFREEEGREVRERGAKLRALIEALKKFSERSSGLIQSSLEVVNFSVSLLSGAASGGKTYSGNGAESSIGEKHTSLVFDVKA